MQNYFEAVKNSITELKDETKRINDSNEILYTGYSKNSDGNYEKGSIKLKGTNNIEVIRIFTNDTVIYPPEVPVLKNFTVYLVTWNTSKPNVKLYYYDTANSSNLITGMISNKIYKVKFTYLSPSIGWVTELSYDSNEESVNFRFGSDVFLWYNSSDYIYMYKNVDNKNMIPDRRGLNDYPINVGGGNGGYMNISGMQNYSPVEVDQIKYGLLYSVNADVSAGSLIPNNGIDLTSGFTGDEFTLIYYVWCPSDTTGSMYQRKSPSLSIGIANTTPQNCIMIKIGGDGFVKIYDGTTLAGTSTGVGSQEVAHIAITYSNSGQEAKVYKNGVLKGTYTLTGSNNIGNRLLISGNFDQTAGMDAYAYGRTFFQDLRIYNNIKTANELLADYNRLVAADGVLN